MAKQFINRNTIVAILNTVNEGEADKVSLYIKNKLTERGWLLAKKDGRKKVFELAPKSRGYLALAKNWGKIQNVRKAN